MYQSGIAWGTPQPPSQELPPGWDVKWDPNSRKWFYVNHSTKTTQWEPPARVTRAPKLVTTSFIQADPEKVKLIQSEFDVDQRTVESNLRVHQNNLESVRKNLFHQGFRKKNVVEPKQHFVSSLKNTFPDASEDIIKEILVSTNNSFAGAKLSLKNMGYQFKVTPANKQAAKKKGTPSAKVASPKKSEPKLTDAKKKKCLDELKLKFPTLSQAIIELALEGTQYNVSLASSLLESSMESVTSNRNQKSSSEFPSYSATTPSTSFVSSGITAPVIFGADDDKPSVSTTPAKSSTSSVSKPAATYQRVSKRKVPSPAIAFFRKLQTEEAYTSKNRITPVGPDPDLFKGPDPSNLVRTLIEPMGPNPDNSNGPDPAIRNGPMKSNHQGRSGINVGPVRGL